MWNPPSTPVADRARAAHEELAGAPAQHVASAPATWVLLGEHIDHFGGMAIVGLSSLRAAAAVSTRDDGKIAVQIEGNEVEYTSLQELSELASVQQPSVDADGQPVLPDAPTGNASLRLAGIVHSLINRQLLSRETTGVTITVANDIPDNAGLGELSAMDVATALALHGEDADDAPLRARLSEVCTQAVTLFSEVPALRARHSAALRGGESITLIDYADHSVTQAPHLLNDDLSAFLIAVPGTPEDTQGAEIRRREHFLDDACHAFGTESLRLLPDATPRVLDWLTAVHKVYGTENQPTVDEARQWLSFYESETQRSQDFARALRSRRGTELFPLIEQSQAALVHEYGMESGSQLSQLAHVRGAVTARTAHAGLVNATIAYVPTKHATNFAADLDADGLIVLPLHSGSPAQLH